jgi:hypothetical protein
MTSSLAKRKPARRRRVTDAGAFGPDDRCGIPQIIRKPVVAALSGEDASERFCFGQNNEGGRGRLRIATDEADQAAIA